MTAQRARTMHLALWLLGLALYVVFVIPRWWVLIGDIPATLATLGRIAAGVPFAAAAVPVAVLLRGALRGEPQDGTESPELPLRLRAWSAVLHVVCGVLIVLTAVAEIWLHSRTAEPWLYALYGAAGSIAILAALAFWLSFVAEKPLAPPKPPRAKKAKKVKVKKTKDQQPAETRSETEDSDADESGGLRNTRPVGKSRLRSQT